MKRRLLTLTAVLTLGLCAPALGSGDAVIADCGDDGKLSQRYSQDDYREALANLPADADNYTDCRDIIRDARLAAATGGGLSAGGGVPGVSGGGPTAGAASLAAGGATADPGGPSDPTAGAGGLSTDGLAGSTPAERDALNRAMRDAAPPSASVQKLITPRATGLQSVSQETSIPSPVAAVLALLGVVGLGAAVLFARRRLRGPRTA